jgi:hypothetical protein
VRETWELDWRSVAKVDRLQRFLGLRRWIGGGNAAGRKALAEPGARLCAIALPEGRASPLYARLRALVQERDATLAIWQQHDAVRQALAVPQGQPLGFPGAAYQCLKAASAAFAAK